MRVNPKSEVRVPKAEGWPKSESRTEATQHIRAAHPAFSDFGLRPSFGFRISDLDFSILRPDRIGTTEDGRLSDLRRRAFTLIELILAIGIMAIVLIAINAVFFSAMRLRERVTSAVNETLPVQQTLSILRRDLQGAMPPASDGILSGNFRVGSVPSAGLGLPVDIELYTTTGVLRETDPWSEVQKVTYQLRQTGNLQSPGNDLIRSVTRNLLATMTPQPEEEFMMSGVESIQFSCYDGSTWYDTWDTTLTTNLPSAVRVRILLANTSGGGVAHPIEMLVPIDSQVRTSLSSSAETGTQ